MLGSLPRPSRPALAALGLTLALGGTLLGVPSSSVAAPDPAAAAPPVEVPDFATGRLLLDVDDRGRLTVRERGGRVLQRDGVVEVQTPLGTARAVGQGSFRRESDRTVVELTTDDPAGMVVRLIASRGRDGSLRMRTVAVGGAAASPAGVTTTVDWATPSSERFYGGGERNDAVQRRGTTLRNYVEDGPYREEDQAFVAATVPLWGFGTRRDSTYFPIPWVLSSRGYGLLVRNDETSTFDLAAAEPGRWRMGVESPDFRWQVYPGPTAADALRRFSADVGRQPDVGADWMFGPWVQTGQADFVPQAEERGAIRALQRHDTPVTVAETHMRYLPCGAHRGLEEAETQRSRWFHSRGLATLSYINPLLCADYAEVFGPAAAAGAVQKNALGAPFLYPAYVGGDPFTVRPLAQFDFTSPAIDDHFGALVDLLIEHEHDGWMEDFGEYTPPGAFDERGRTASELHNAYVRDYHCGTQRMAAGSPRPLVRFVRSGWTGSARCSPVVWGGDPTSLWGFDGLKSVVTAGLSSGLSGIGIWGSDIGGFFALNQVALTPELMYRWVQVGAFSGIMRAKNDGVEVPDKTRPLVWEEPHRTMWRRYSKLRTQLAPYLVAASAEYRRGGLPMMRHLVLSYPGSRAARQGDVYTLGRDLLVAPVLSPNQRHRRLVLPPGRWVDVWRSARFAEGPGALDLGRARVLDGGREVRVPAPLDQVPLFVRAGAVLPLLAPDVDTLTSYGRGSDVVRAADREGRRQLLAYPAAGRTVSPMGRTERLVSTASRAGWSLQVEGRRVRTYTVQAALSGSPLDGAEICRVTLDGRPLPRSAWRLATDRTLDVTLTTRSGTLRVTPC